MRFRVHPLTQTGVAAGIQCTDAGTAGWPRPAGCDLQPKRAGKAQLALKRWEGFDWDAAHGDPQGRTQECGGAFHRTGGRGGGTWGCWERAAGTGTANTREIKIYRT